MILPKFRLVTAVRDQEWTFRRCLFRSPGGFGRRFPVAKGFAPRPGSAFYYSLDPINSKAVTQIQLLQNDQTVKQ